MMLESSLGGGILSAGSKGLTAAKAVKAGSTLAGTLAMGTQIAGNDYNELTGMMSKEEAVQKGLTPEILRQRGIDYNQLPDKKVTPERALVAGLTDAVIEAPLEQFAFSKILKTLLLCINK